MPTFCRHGRVEANCPICSKSATPARPSSRSSGRRPASSGARKAPARSARGGGLKVRRLARAEDDGYDNGLVPGLRATVEAERLAAELAFATARLEELREDPPGLYAEARAAGGEDGLWLAFL